ncbi:hypothetical protein OIU84_014370 [Salix udensis]|uniref:Protein kinase domain-containing protein n=1 Tax=Salix udensis TaxID=889485 RepID=A0AAD6NRY2_9ROSI|nr:hypothetical protein OIU84_014370 [Salix udensis]
MLENRGDDRVPLNWAARLSIIRDIAKGMAFLHQSLPSHKVPHANLKSSNVLIHRDGQSYHSKLTDYGFLPLLPSRKSSERLAVGRMVVNNDWSTDILDEEILDSREGHGEMLKLTEIALQCTDMAPEKRPGMSEVLGRIEEI